MMHACLYVLQTHTQEHTNPHWTSIIIKERPQSAAVMRLYRLQRERRRCIAGRALRILKWSSGSTWIGHIHMCSIITHVSCYTSYVIVGDADKNYTIRIYYAGGDMICINANALSFIIISSISYHRSSSSTSSFNPTFGIASIYYRSRSNFVHFFHTRMCMNILIRANSIWRWRRIEGVLKTRAVSFQDFVFSTFRNGFSKLTICFTFKCRVFWLRAPNQSILVFNFVPVWKKWYENSICADFETRTWSIGFQMVFIRCRENPSWAAHTTCTALYAITLHASRAEDYQLRLGTINHETQNIF